MPELLEIEAYRQAAEAAVGRTIAAVVAPDPWFLKGGLTARAAGRVLRSRSVTAARRRGKLLVLDLDGTGPSVGLRFGMTGRLLVDGAAPIEKLEYGSARREPAWDRFTLRFADGGALVISDPRRLGGVELDPDEERLGPDAGEVALSHLRSVLARSAAPVKAVLMDQARVAGLGNLLTDELLWRAGVDPARPARSLGVGEQAAVHRAMQTTLRVLGRRGGSHLGDHMPARSPGAVCPRDGAPMLRRTVGGRTTYSCSAHQR